MPDHNEPKPLKFVWVFVLVLIMMAGCYSQDQRATLTITYVDGTVEVFTVSPLDGTTWIHGNEYGLSFRVNGYKRYIIRTAMRSYVLTNER